MAASAALTWICLLSISAAYISAAELEGGDFPAFKHDDPFDRFDYSFGPYGPANWGRLRGDWRTCSDGLSQSPMAMENGMMVLDPSLGPLRAEYKTANATIVNVGRSIQVWWPGAGSLIIGNTTYYIKDIDFHTPSEHTLGLFNDRFPLEMHMVHRSKNHQKIAVIAILFTFGAEDKFLAQFFNRLPPLSTKNQVFNLGEISARHLTVPLGQHYGRYTGSETHPPCNEGVLWTVVHYEGHTVSMDQLVKLKQVIESDNARPLQASNGRKFNFV
ncbi:hypothetical protein R1flu_022533 [Riccia fluitans]|uniref:Alpha-carbonic anhydrase domain-containing protein n=1 Tax=Riccia fluitans TaxID=41844 RepID=A0ABD1XSG8_9MARC